MSNFPLSFRPSAVPKYLNLFILFYFFFFFFLLGANQKEHRLTDVEKEMEIKAMNEGINVLHIKQKKMAKIYAKKIKTFTSQDELFVGKNI